MTLRFMDSFDHYATANILKKWSSIYGDVTIVSGGRFGTNCMQIAGNAYAKRALGVNASTLIVGFAVNFGSVGSFHPIVQLWDSSITQISVNGSATAGLLEIRRGNAGDSPLLATAETPVNAGVWYYLEIKVVFHDSAGSVELKINNTTYASATGIDTVASANAYANSFSFNNASFYPATLYDDLYVCDGLGAVNNNFLGDHRVECLFPSGAGAHAEWTPSAGSNYQNVDDATPDDDTTYNSQNDADLPETDTFAMTNLVSTTGTIAGVQSLLYVRKDDAGDVTVNPVFRISTTDYNGAGTNVPDTYLYRSEIFEKSPATDAAWAIAEINGLESGYKRTA